MGGAFFRPGTLVAMDRVVLVAHLRPDARERVRELLARDRAAAPGENGIERKAIYLSESEVVFLFEGAEADESLRALFNDPVRSSELGPWLPLFEGPLHRAVEVYSWNRETVPPP
jgi:hypothetical protein